jgi:hypothetical protein
VITFKSTEDLAKLSPTDPAYATVQELVERLITAYTTPGQPFNHEDYSCVLLIEESDVGLPPVCQTPKWLIMSMMTSDGTIEITKIILPIALSLFRRAVVGYFVYSIILIF